MSSALYTLGRWCHQHRRHVLATWLLALTLIASLAVAIGTGTKEEYRVPNSESQEALDYIKGTFPEISGTSAQIIVIAPNGHTITDRAIRTDIENSIKRIENIDSVKVVTNPYDKNVSGSLSADNRAALINIQFTGDFFSITDTTRDTLTNEANTLTHNGTRAVAGGAIYNNAVPTMSWTEGIGLILSALVLLIFFRAVRATAAPIVSALLGAGVSLALLFLATSITVLTDTTPMLALMIGMAVGIDYSLFLLARHRENLLAGIDPAESAARATATAGSAVLFAGFTVITALAGLSVVGLPFLTTMGIGSAIAVAIAVAAALTITPALMSLLGRNILAHRQRTNPPRHATAGPRWAHIWIRTVTRFPLLTIIILTSALIFASIPARNLELALPDAGTTNPGTNARLTYDLTAEHFGPGANGPLLVVADIVKSERPRELMDDLKKEVASIPGIHHVSLATPNRNADTGVVIAIPTTAPSDPATTQLVHEIRNRATTWEKRYDTTLSVTGATAAQIDISEMLGKALIPFALVVMGLCLLLLLIVFRSILVPLTATLGFLLSVLTAFGAVAAVYSWGWFAEPLSVSRLGPVISFMPIILMGVLFGLAMDYQMFIVSRMHEHYSHNGDPDSAVENGFAAAAPVVTAAAVIMVGIFAAFVPHGSATIKPIALGLAVGVFVDAFIVRMAIVPAALKLFGHGAWWLPGKLATNLPAIDVEGSGVMRQIAAQKTSNRHPQRIVHATNLTVRGGRGTVFSDLNLTLNDGQLAVLAGPEGSGKTTAILTLAGRIYPSAGDLVVNGHVMPEHSGTIQHLASLAEIHGVNPLENDLSVKQNIAETLSTRTLMPWARRRDIDAVMTSLNHLITYALDTAELPIEPTAGNSRLVHRDTLVRDLPRLSRMLLGIVLATIGRPPFILIDDIDTLRTIPERRGAWAAIGLLLSERDTPLAILTACQDSMNIDELTTLTGLPETDITQINLADIYNPADAPQTTEETVTQQPATTASKAHN
ncbi:Putative membrane protein ydgH [Dermatophilus congolensis]|uniref:Putative membrane protein ydgH n=3 Tax=Dermatophilus congolensis TaxID=1863 RepID=A0A239VLA3_9MICO|nr:MMPL family transporter [Dermatophilus congolensis]SNV22589.1 Putative membrane protein ydgH [Dermatophilus congolensis]